MERTVSQVHERHLEDFFAALAVPNSVKVVWFVRALGKHLVVNEVKTIVNLRFGQSLLIWLYATILGLGVSISNNN